MKPIDLSKVKAESPAFKGPLPNNAYQVRIVQITRQPLQLEVQFAVTSGDFSGRIIRHWFKLDADWALAHLKKLCEAISTDGKAPDSLEDQYIKFMEGKDLIIRTIIEKTENGDFPKIQDFVADSQENYMRLADEASNSPEFIVRKPKQQGYGEQKQAPTQDYPSGQW